MGIGPAHLLDPCCVLFALFFKSFPLYSIPHYLSILVNYVLYIDAGSSGEEHLSEEEESAGESWSQPPPPPCLSLPMDIPQGPAGPEGLPGLFLPCAVQWYNRRNEK